MKNTKVNLEQGKMTEREVRDANDRAAKNMATLAEKQGKGVVSHEEMRRKAEEYANKANREGKI